jgi:hypothetical protein
MLPAKVELPDPPSAAGAVRKTADDARSVRFLMLMMCASKVRLEQTPTVRTELIVRVHFLMTVAARGSLVG